MSQRALTQGMIREIMQKSLETLDGVLNLNKPAGMTSHDVVDRIRQVIRDRRIRVGHTGTLDPMATGVLPLCVGKATKIVQFLIAEDKEYRVDMRLGIITDTQDTTGEILGERPVPPLTEDRIHDVLQQYRGELLQTPPMISAKHHKGKRLYELARQGMEVKREPCKIIIHELTCECVDLPTIRFRVMCSKGTYIRTLCHDIGETLGTGAAMSALIRVRCGAFHLDQAIDLEAFQTRDDVSRRLCGLSDALSSMPLVMVGIEGKASISCGRNLAGGLIKRRVGDFETGMFVRIASRDGRLIGVGEALLASGQLDALAGNLSVVKPIKYFAHPSF